MVKYSMRFIILAAVTVPSALSMASPETWHLEKAEQGQDPLKPLSPESSDANVAGIKQLLEAGQCRAAEQALEQLKKDYPEIVGPDPNAFDAFFKAEMLRCKGKLAKAAMSYDKFLTKYRHKSELYEAAWDRQIDIAREFLNGRKKTVLGIFKIKGYAEGEAIIKRITAPDRVDFDDPVRLKATKTIAESYEKRKKFNDAFPMWQEIFSQWETGQTGKDALLAMARCKHAAYKGPKYDASDLISAKDYYEKYEKYRLDEEYEEFRTLYPEFTEDIGAEKILRQINGQLAFKQFSIGRYYERTGDKNARQMANFYYEMVIGKWYEKFILQYPESAEKISVDKILKQISTSRGYQESGNEKVDNFVIDNWPESVAAKMAYEAYEMTNDKGTPQEPAR